MKPLLTDYQRAERLAQTWAEVRDGELQLDRTITRPYGWVFFIRVPDSDRAHRMLVDKRAFELRCLPAVPHPFERLQAEKERYDLVVALAWYESHQRIGTIRMAPEMPPYPTAEFDSSPPLVPDEPIDIGKFSDNAKATFERMKQKLGPTHRWKLETPP